MSGTVRKKVEKEEKFYMKCEFFSSNMVNLWWYEKQRRKVLSTSTKKKFHAHFFSTSRNIYVHYGVSSFVIWQQQKAKKNYVEVLLSMMMIMVAMSGGSEVARVYAERGFVVWQSRRECRKWMRKWKLSTFPFSLRYIHRVLALTIH